MAQTSYLNFNNDNNLHILSRPNTGAFNLLNQSFPVLQFLPRNFKITTKNSIYKFNIDMLKDTSSVIFNSLANDPQKLQYHLDIIDEKNVMAKIEQLYRGQKAIFNDNELFFGQKISELLNLVSFPNFLKPFNLRNNNNNQLYNYRLKYDNNYTVQLSTESLIAFLQNTFEKSFKIIVNDKEYNCNIIGIRSSKKISEMIEKDPNLNQFVYEIDDDFDDFQLICDLFNFESIQITNDNMNSLKQFAEDLQIECIFNKINKFIEFYENASQEIDDKQAIINEIDEIFELLYNRNNQTIEFITNSIINSKWSKTDENVLELAAFILQLISTNFKYHQMLFDLIINLDKEAKNCCHLKLLIPTIAKQLMSSFANKRSNCAFIYRLYKVGIIPKDEILFKIKQIYNKTIPKPNSFAIYHTRSDEEIKFSNAVSYFIPEIEQINDIDLDSILLKCSTNVYDFVYKKYKQNPDEYFKLRDMGEPNDAVTRAITYDDLDTLQKIISQRSDFSNLEELKIPFSIYNSFVQTEATSYINFAAYCGSLHCFKFLLLNHCKIDKYTLQCAVFGENYEIIRIVDQCYNESNIQIEYSQNKYLTKESNLAFNPIIPAIMKHQNDLFDWILQEKYINQGKTGECLFELVYITSLNGNAHALIKYIDNGLDMNSIMYPIITKAFEESLKMGYFRYSQLFLNFIKNRNQNEESFITSSIYFGNLSIFKLFFENNKSNLKYDQSLIAATQNDHFNIVKYIVEYLLQNNINLTKEGILTCLNESIQIKSEVFGYLINKFDFELLIKRYKFTVDDFIDVLSNGCQINSFENVKILTNLILEKYPTALFTNPFIIAVEKEFYDIYKYFIDRKVSLDLNTLANQSIKLKSINVDVFRHLIEKAEPEMKEILFGNFLSHSLKSQNKDLVEFLLSQNIPYENALFDSILSNDVEIVKIVLKHNNKLSFINKLSEKGTPLFFAVKLGYSEIVKYLLSVPGINPNLYQQSNQTPLIYAITNFDLQNIDLLIDFYGDEIQSQMWQINEALEEILEKISNEENKKLSDRYNYLYLNNENDSQTKLIDHQLVLIVIKRLLAIKNLDLNCHAQKHTLLTYACQKNDIDLVKMLIESENVNINSYAPKDGNTPLMIAIENKNIDIAKLIIESPKSDINLNNYNNETALTIAIKLKLPEIVTILINSKKFDSVESRIDYAFFLSSGEIAKLFLPIPKLDVNFRLISSRNPNESHIFETSLIHAVKLKDIEKVRLIINHPSFDKVKSQIKTSIFTATELDEIDIFRELMPLIDNDVNIFFGANESLLVCAVKNKSESIVTEILNNDKFDSKKSNILQAFISTYSFIPQNKDDSFDALINSMILIYNYDVFHDHLIDLTKLLPNGKSFLTSIICELTNADNVVEFLLNNGANPDEPDSNGIYPLQQAIEINSYPFVVALIETRNVDLHRKFTCSIIKTISNKYDNKYKQYFISDSDHSTRNDLTYLHLAAKQKDQRILNELLNVNEIDINSLDDFGESALFIAFRSLNNVVIQNLFLLDNLDYKIRNKRGNDVFDLACNKLDLIVSKQKRMVLRRGLIIPIINQPIETKGDYISKLLEILNFIAQFCK